MAVSKNEVQVQWSASDSVSVSSGGNQTSDAFTVSTDAFYLGIQGKADNAGTPASDDTIDLYLLPTAGDPDGSGSDEYATSGHGIFLMQLDTNTEDPAQSYIQLPAAMKGGKIYAESGAASNSITVSATVYEIQG